MHGHWQRDVLSSTAVCGDELHTYVRPLPSLAGRRGASSHDMRAHPKMRGVRGPADPSEGSRAFRRANPLLEPAAHPLSCTSAREEDGCPFRISRAHRTAAPRKRAAAATIDLPFRAIPRRLARPLKTRVRSTESRSVRLAGDCSPLPRPNGPSATRYLRPPEELRRLAARRTSASLTPSRCPV